MDELLRKICEKYNVDPDVLEQIIKIEKKYVYKQKRIGITENLKSIIETTIKEDKRDLIDNK